MVFFQTSKILRHFLNIQEYHPIGGLYVDAINHSAVYMLR